LIIDPASLASAPLWLPFADTTLHTIWLRSAYRVR
jgi:hypothetical protein